MGLPDQERSANHNGGDLMLINIAEDFSRYPAGRHPEDGDQTGERFRKDHLEKYLKETQETVEVNLDGAVGYPSSFLEEAFGGLVRCGFSVDLLRKRLIITTTEARKNRYIDQIWQYIKEARAPSIA